MYVFYFTEIYYVRTSIKLFLNFDMSDKNNNVTRFNIFVINFELFKANRKFYLRNK